MLMGLMSKPIELVVWGFIVRDHVGSVVGSGAGRIEHCTDAMYAKAMATLHALSFASEAGMSFWIKGYFH
jgi:hypothetical protein